MRILFLDDDPARREAACAHLRTCGQMVDGYAEDAEPPAKEYDTLFLTCHMPSMRGFALLERFSPLPAQFMYETDGITGIHDLETKAMTPTALRARLDEMLRHAKKERGLLLQIGELVLDRDERTILWQCIPLRLTAKEFDLLFHLLSHPRTVFDRETLMEAIWPKNTSSVLRTVDVHISRVRTKLGDCDDIELVTVPGEGYYAKINDQRGR